jgi:hypothetical protein
MKQKKRDGWYIRKSLPHFDFPLNFNDAYELVTDRSKIASHSFWPFIGYSDKKRRFRKINKEVKISSKVRPIRYCSHVDGYIYSYYCGMLNEAYELYIRETKISPTVIAYRKGIGNNIRFARQAFDEIRRRRRSCVICLDLKSFFDNIDHKILKRNLKLVLGVDLLPMDWYKIFRSLTQYSWVEYEVLIQLLDIDTANPPRRFCDATTFREKVKCDKNSILQTNRSGTGIPQGSPLSAALSNVYMLGFDRALANYADQKGAYYRRYADDILIICAPYQGKRFFNKINKELRHLGSTICVSEDKTEIAVFCKSGKNLVSDRPITYLGFKFDGRRVLFRDRTISRYYRRMTYVVRRIARPDLVKRGAKIYKRTLLRQFSHLGHSNFYSYTRRAAREFGGRSLRRQLRRHVSILMRKVKSRGR